MGNHYGRNEPSVGLGLFGLLLIVAAFGLFVTQVIGGIRCEFTFNRDYHSMWALADKSSTIAAKYQYINSFVDVLSSNQESFAENSAIIMKTPDNSFSNNLTAVTTLRDRLHDIQGMDENSFQYQTAIQQITEQELGQAQALLAVIKSCYALHNYWYCWNWIGMLVMGTYVLLFVIGVVCLKNS